MLKSIHKKWQLLSCNVIIGKDTEICKHAASQGTRQPDKLGTIITSQLNTINGY